MPIIRTFVLSKAVDNELEKIPKGEISDTVNDILAAYFQTNPVDSEEPSPRARPRRMRYPEREITVSDL